MRPDETPEASPSRAQPLALPPPALNADWTHRNGAAAGRLAHPALRPVPQLIWSVDLGTGDAKRRRLLTGPIVSGGLIFAMDAAGQLSAVTRDGRLAWSRSLVPAAQVPDSGPGGGMAAAGGVLYVTTGFGEVFALDPRTGGTIWQVTLEAPIRAAPAVDDGRVIVVLRDDTSYALDAGSGATLWRMQGAGGTGLLGGASPAADGQLVVLPFASGEVLGVLARNGLTVWGTAVTGGRRDLARNRINDVSGDPVIDGDAIFASNQSGRTVRIDAHHRRADLDHARRLVRPGLAGRRLGVPAVGHRLAGAGRRRDRRRSSGPCSCPSCSRNRGFFGRGKPLRGDPLLRAGPGRRAALGGRGRRAAARLQPGRRQRRSTQVPLPGGAAAAPAVAGGRAVRRHAATGGFWLSNDRPRR